MWAALHTHSIRGGERVIDRRPVDSRAFHRRVGSRSAQRANMPPSAAAAATTKKRASARSRSARPAPRRDSRTATSDDFCARRSRRRADERYPSPPPQVPDNTLDTGAPPAEPAQDRDPVTRARSSNPGSVRAGSQRHLTHRHAAPRGTTSAGGGAPSSSRSAGATSSGMKSHTGMNRVCRGVPARRSCPARAPWLYAPAVMRRIPRSAGTGTIRPLASRPP